MKIQTKPLITFFTAAALSLSLAACGSNTAEDAGEKVDEAISNTGNMMEDGDEKVDDILTDTGNAIEDTCENVKEKVGANDTDC